MKALILNSGMGSRMGRYTEKSPKCMIRLQENAGKAETILSRQIRFLEQAGIHEIIMTTGFAHEILQDYCESLRFKGKITYVHNDAYNKTNYIYSIYLANKYLRDDILLMHGDMVFEKDILLELMQSNQSSVCVDSVMALPDKDFKAVIQEKNSQIMKIGIEFFADAVAAFPLYKIFRLDWEQWLDEISIFCESGKTGCYAEAAFNEVSGRCRLFPLDIAGRLCREVDTEKDLEEVKGFLRNQ